MADPPREFRVATVHVNGSTTVEVGGEVDLAVADDLAARLEAIADASSGAVTVDLSQVTFLDSSGATALVLTHRRLGAEGRQLTVRRPSQMVSRVFEITGLATVLDVRGAAAPLAAD